MARRMTWMVALPAAKTIALGGRGRRWSAALRDDPLLEEPRLRVVAALGENGTTLTGPQRRRVLFMTAAAGIARAGDPVPDEQLAIGRALDGVGVLATFWRPHLEAWLAAHLSGGGVLWDLLGGEYARGLVARHLVTSSTCPADPERALESFRVEVAGSHWAVGQVADEGPVLRPETQAWD